MSLSDTPRQKRTDLEPLRQFYLGRDAEGDVHHFDRRKGVVYTITPDGERPYTDELRATEIAAYWNYVESVRGEWREICIPACTFAAALEDD